MENATPFTIDFRDTYVLVKFLPGTSITLEIIMAVLEQERGLPENQHINDIWDGRGCTISSRLNSESISAIVGLLQSNPHYSSHKKTAFLFDSLLLFGITRMFQLMGEYLPYQTQAVEDENLAICWIEENEAKASTIPQ
jgi:hypothetical protein